MLVGAACATQDITLEDGAMPDTEIDTAATDIADAAAVTDAPDAAADTATAELGDGGKKAIEAEREARKIAEKRMRELEKSLKEYEDRDKTELQRANERAEAAERRAAEAEETARRNKVAAMKGVPASSLTGKTEEELIASADELIAWRDQNKTATPAPRRTAPAGGGLKSGASSTETINHDPKAAAAEALRRLRQSG